jgi:hypothetical protein
VFARHDRFLLILNDSDLMVQQLAAPRLERAIGVIYRPETERQSHYFGRDWSNNSTPYSISTIRVRSSRPNPRRSGKPASFRRRSRSRCNKHRSPGKRRGGCAHIR